MLVLTRKIGESITIGDDIRIVVMQVKGKQVRLGIKASPNTVVHREEVYQRIMEENRIAATSETKPDLKILSEIIRKEQDPTAESESAEKSPVKWVRRRASSSE